MCHNSKLMFFDVFKNFKLITNREIQLMNLWLIPQNLFSHAAVET